MLIDRGDRSAEPGAAMAKAYGIRLANDVVREAIQIYLEMFKGANELQQWIIARKLVGRDITG